ncbi:MAG: response regulator transcription factor [Deltaproteobacteria bacterium]|jgi:two-component system OmpR family response regulator|nr:response regulator transcription factor [Deltaproteobacteria bacterium]
MPQDRTLPARCVLVVDDDPHISEVVEYALSSAGFRVVTSQDGEGAVRIAGEGGIDLVVLDINLPGRDGMWVLRTLRGSSTVPVILLSARDEELDRVMGLTLGGDDYVTKPFSPRELVARVEAVLRRNPATGPGPAPPAGPPASPPTPPPGLLSEGPLALDREAMEASWDGARVDLTPTEFRILLALAMKPGKVFSRDELIGLASPDAAVSDRVVDSHILHIRKKFQRAGGEVIQTRHGVGYRLAPLAGDCGEG